MSEHLQFKAGERVEVLRSIDLLPHTVLVPGEKGTVVRVIDDMGIHAIEIELDVSHEGLKGWDNKALLTWPETAYINSLKTKAKQPLRTLAAVLTWGGTATALGTLKAHAAVLAAVLAHGLLALS